MEPLPRRGKRRRPYRLDVVLLATIGSLLLLTLVPLVDPGQGITVVIIDRTLDVALTSLTLVATAGVAALTLLRYRESGRLALFLQTSAFVLWATFAAASVSLMLLKLDGRLGLSLGIPEQLPLWVSAATRLTQAGLFLASGIAALRALRGGPRHAARMLLAPVLAIGLLGIALYPVRDLLPALIGSEGIDALLDELGGNQRLPGVTWLALASVVAGVVMLGGAVALYRTTWRRGGPTSDGFLAVGLAVMAMAELQYAFWPSVYTGLVTISDLLRLATCAIVVAGLVAEQRSDLRALRAAYAALDRMRVSEAERAALEERARLAREIHDGLAQHLWFAKLKFERLAASIPEEDRALAGEVGQALDTAIVEARQALVTMRAELDQEMMPLADLLRRNVDDFGGRSGLRVEFAAGSGLPQGIPPRQQIELLRIVSEALTNVRKHADATVVRVRVEASGRDLVVSVSDNGRGFDPAQAVDEGLGLQGMEERARIIGGELVLESEPSGGTTVTVRVPIHAATVAGSPEATAADESARGVEPERPAVATPPLG